MAPGTGCTPGDSGRCPYGSALRGGINVAQSQNEPTPAYPAAEKHKPTTLPDRIMLTNEADPSDSQSVTWRTDTTVKTAQAQIAKAGGRARLQGTP